MNAQNLKKPALILSLLVIVAVIFWPLPAQFKFIGSQFLTFALALYIGLRIWRSSPKGQWLMDFQRHSSQSWIIYVAILLLAALITYLTINYLGYWPRALIEFILVLGIIFYALREFKRFLI